MPAPSAWQSNTTYYTEVKKLIELFFGRDPASRPDSEHEFQTQGRPSAHDGCTSMMASCRNGLAILKPASSLPLDDCRSFRMQLLIICRHVIPGGRLIPAQGIGIEDVGVDPNPRLGESRSVSSARPEQGKIQPRPHFLGHPECECSLALGVSARIDLGESGALRQTLSKPGISLGQQGYMNVVPNVGGAGA